MNVIPIAFAFDNNLILPACVCISSLLMNAKEDTFYDIYILHSKREKLNHEELDKISYIYSNSRIQYISVGDVFDNAFEIRGITTPTYYRLLIPELIRDYEKVFYADVDIIFRTDLTKLYEMDLTDYYVAATLDLGMNYIDDGINYIKSISGLSVGEYIQAGFLLLNVLKLRKDGIVNLFKELVFKNFKFQDQDIINVVCRGKIKIIPWHYNMTTYSFYCLEKEQNILGKDLMKTEDLARYKSNIHYNGQKPWKDGCVNFDIWWEYYRKSPYFNHSYYFDFFNKMSNAHDYLSLWKRVKILIRYFSYGQKRV